MGLFENIYNSGAEVFGYDSTADTARKEQLAQAKQVAQQQQSQLAADNRGLQVGQYDSPAISQCVNWGGFGHSEIYKTNQESIDQGRVGEVAQAWIKLAGKLRERGQNYSKDLGEIVRGGWQGEAADKAAEVGKPASEWMVQSADAFEATGNNLNAAGDAAGKSKQMVPKPEGFSWGQTAANAIPFGLSGAGMDAVNQMEQQEEAEKAAQGTMGRVYSPTLTQVDGQMPQYTKPDGNTAHPPAVPPQDGTNWGSGMPSGAGTGSGAGVGSGGTAQGIGNVGSGVPGSGIPGGSPSPSQTDSAWASNPAGAGAGVPGAGAGTGAGAPGAGGGVGVAGGLGAGGAAGAGRGAGAGGARGLGAGGAGGARGAGMGAGGRASAGGLGSGAGGAGAGAGAAGRGGAGGRGMMGPGAGRGQGQGGDEEEHERPSWLEEQDDVWMNDMPKTAPPVLGE
ncbi:hypothetical protein GCM10009854_05130 [Saccharopolyspora halophila]|uniref:PPE domain-containing protein n=1 Tax=Saccharopolyspora halophila TaxID=405551 RepID=A0ABP5SJR4_9PSEU